MQLLYDLLNCTQQSNHASLSTDPPHFFQTFHSNNIIQQRLIVPGLPTPFHYLNFIITHPTLCHIDQYDHNKETTSADNVLSVLCSTSLHLNSYLNFYSIQQDCRVEQAYLFGDRESITGNFPTLFLERNDAELKVKLKIEVLPFVTYLEKMRFGLSRFWTIPCFCQGEVQYKNTQFSIEGMGSLESYQKKKLCFVDVAFHTYQIVNLSAQQQIIFRQKRNGKNQILSSQICLRDYKNQKNYYFDRNVLFKIHRMYPKIITPDGKPMYLPREFEWQMQNDDGFVINFFAKSRGDFKFGVGQGYVGSFQYTIKINGKEENGEAGYIEYQDLRKLQFQECENLHQSLSLKANPVPIVLKK